MPTTRGATEAKTAPTAGRDLGHRVWRMTFDAVILAGGRSARLGGQPKAELIVDGTALLARTVHASSGAASIVIVGEASATPAAHTILVREDPAFGGPVAAIGAALTALAETDARQADWTLVLACDMPLISTAVPSLIEAASRAGRGTDAVVAVDDSGRTQHLAAVYRTSVLREQLTALGALSGRSMRTLAATMTLTEVATGNATQDIDTWDDAARFGIAAPGTSMYARDGGRSDPGAQ